MQPSQRSNKALTSCGCDVSAPAGGTVTAAKVSGTRSNGTGRGFIPLGCAADGRPPGLCLWRPGRAPPPNCVRSSFFGRERLRLGPGAMPATQSVSPRSPSASTAAPQGAADALAARRRATRACATVRRKCRPPLLLGERPMIGTPGRHKRPASRRK